jgi:hypothetical protein
MNRRTFLRAAGLTGASALGLGASGTAAANHTAYRYHGTAPAPGVQELVTFGDYAYCATEGAITTVDLSDPTMPITAGRTQGPDPTTTADVKVEEYTTDGGETRRIAVLTHTRQESRFSVFDVTDPTSPEYLTSVDTASTVHNCFFKDGYAYLCISDSFPTSRMVIFDLSDPENPTTLEGLGDYTDHTDVPDEEVGTGGSWTLGDARPDMAESGGNVLHDIYVAEQPGGELAYLAYWEAGIVVVDVTVKERPIAVAHFGAVPYADADSVGTVQYVNGGGESNAHYVQPTPSGDYTFVGAETFGGTGHEDVGATGDHGGIRVFDTSSDRIAPLQRGGRAIYPEADPTEELPFWRKDQMGDDAPVQRPTDRRNSDNPADYVAYIEAPDQPDDALLTSHNFDVTDTKLFASWYQGGIRAYDLAPLYRSGRYEEHPSSAADIEVPEEIAAFAPDGMAFWTAENLSAARDGDTYFTIGSDIGKGAVVLELTDGLSTPLGGL